MATSCKSVYKLLLSEKTVTQFNQISYYHTSRHNKADLTTTDNLQDLKSCVTSGYGPDQRVSSECIVLPFHETMKKLSFRKRMQVRKTS